MRSEGDFICESGLSVSRAEMNANPLQTTQIVCELKGWEWASRLWQEWNDTLPGGMGATPQHHQSSQVRRWLNDHRPELEAERKGEHR